MQERNMLKPGIRVIQKGNLWYIEEGERRVKRFKPWLGDSFSFLYDYIMKSTIFPKKFDGDIAKHYEILSQELKEVHKKRVLELATGSGSAIHFLNSDNHYTGTDISSGLLRKAVKKFRAAGFRQAEFYVTSVEDLPFDHDIFDICLCILSLNFFSDVEKVIQEINRVLVPHGIFFGSIPVPERNRVGSTIRGTLYSEEELEKIYREHGFRFERIPHENGALLYFKAIME
jgi:SAM-dependent methyltransferase